MSKVKTIENDSLMNVSSNKKPKGKTAKEIIAKHITDKNDVISDEDFKNLYLDLENAEERIEPLPLKENKERPKDEEKDPKINTPWKLIEEQ